MKLNLKKREIIQNKLNEKRSVGGGGTQSTAIGTMPSGIITSNIFGADDDHQQHFASVIIKADEILDQAAQLNINPKISYNRNSKLQGKLKSSFGGNSLNSISSPHTDDSKSKFTTKVQKPKQ